MLKQVTESDSLQGNASHAYGYDNVNRLTSATHSNQPSESYAYDSVGNRTSSHQSTGCQYQPFNQLTSTTRLSYSFDAGVCANRRGCGGGRASRD